MNETNSYAQDQTWRCAEVILTGVHRDVFALASHVALIDPDERVPEVLIPRLRNLQTALKRVGVIAYERVYDELDRSEETTTLTDAIAKLDDIENRVRLVKERCSAALKESGADVKVNPTLVYHIDDILGTLHVACCFTERKEIVAADASNDGGETR